MFMEIQGLKKSFGSGSNKVTVLKGIDFSLERGEFCVLLGPSGSGKSTLLNIIGGIDTPDRGAVIVNGEKMADMTEKTLTKYRRNHLGYVFQMYNLIPNLNVQENIEVGAYLSDDPLDVNELMHTLGLYEHRHKMPNQLSGGQQQRTSIGRAIVKNPDILLCDEPTGALDYNTSKEILSLIAMVVAGFCAYLLLGAVGSYLNREIGRLIQIIILLLIVCIVYKLANLIFTSISLVSRLPLIRSADKLFGAVFGILEGIIITGYILYWLKNWGLSVLG